MEIYLDLRRTTFSHLPGTLPKTPNRLPAWDDQNPNLAAWGLGLEKMNTSVHGKHYIPYVTVCWTKFLCGEMGGISIFEYHINNHLTTFYESEVDFSFSNKCLYGHVWPVSHQRSPFHSHIFFTFRTISDFLEILTNWNSAKIESVMKEYI